MHHYFNQQFTPTDPINCYMHVKETNAYETKFCYFPNQIMAYLRLAPLAVIFLFAVMFAVEKTEGGLPICGETCFTGTCYTPGCTCSYPVCKKNHIIAIAAQAVDQHRLLCESHEDCLKKGTGNYCASFPNSDIHFGWCFFAESEGYLLKDFLKMSKDDLKMPMEITN